MSKSDFRPGSKKLPTVVIESFEALCVAAQMPRRLCIMAVKTVGGNKTHHVVAVVEEDGSNAVPVAVIPSDGNVVEYLKHYDRMLAAGGGPESDPDFKGVRQ